MKNMSSTSSNSSSSKQRTRRLKPPRLVLLNHNSNSKNKIQNQQLHHGIENFLTSKMTSVCTLLCLIFVLNAGNLFYNLRSYQTQTRRLVDTNAQQQQPVVEKIADIAYVVTITNCRPKRRAAMFDAAMVLKRSIEINSWPLHAESQYEANFHVIMHAPGNPECHKLFKRAGYTVEAKEHLVYPDQIDNATYGNFLRDKIVKDGCCGLDELLKLHAFGLTNYKIAVHLDLDTLLLQPLDELFNVMYFEPDTPQGKQARQHFVQQQLVAPTYNTNFTTATSKAANASTPHSLLKLEEMIVDHFYTKDYNMIPPGREGAIGIQGGFFLVRPNITRRDELAEMVKTGHYIPGRDGITSGWFGSGYGKHIWGSMTIQGLLAYYFDRIVPTRSVELHRCKFNSIADNPRRSSFDPQGKYARGSPLNTTSTADWHDTTCRDGRENCDDVQCQNWPIEDTRLFHYTCNCKIPWICRPLYEPFFLFDPTCKTMITKWFEIRQSLQTLGRDKGPIADGQFQTDSSLGYCRNESDYIFIKS